MKCCHSQCVGIEKLFDAKVARRELKRYRKKGPSKTTRMLLAAVKAQGVQGLSLLDIGGGIGAIQHELLKAGVSRATSVDASTAYLQAAQEEATRQGHAGRMSFHHGDFVELAPSVSPADIVTLDRVICCYHDFRALVGLSSARANRLYAVVYPRDTWWVRTGIAVLNFFLWLLRDPFRVFVHPSRAVEAVVVDAGLVQQFYQKTIVWQVVIYGR